ncbi:MAG TPA: ABC transporter ATP-binding protein [Candidatus Wallbacteria bacterium]|nr:ABC transporter ATP-binding protein [Candidatus Wallbacteria bacterium]
MHNKIMEAEDISFSYGGRHVLKNISLNIHAGEVLSILGPNGAGKTTLLNCLLNFVKPVGGRIKLKGKPAEEYKRRDFCRIVSFVPQMHRPVFDYTVEEIVLMGKNPHLEGCAAPSKKDRAEALAALAELNIEHLRDARYTKISGGELRLALIARAIVQATEMIFLDEPAAHLDLKNQLGIMRVIRGLAAVKKMAAVMVVHDPDHALAYSDRALLLKDGLSVAAGAPSETITSENLMSVYGVDAAIVEFEGRKKVMIRNNI